MKPYYVDQYLLFLSYWTKFVRWRETKLDTHGIVLRIDPVCMSFFLQLIRTLSFPSNLYFLAIPILPLSLCRSSFYQASSFLIPFSLFLAFSRYHILFIFSTYEVNFQASFFFLSWICKEMKKNCRYRIEGLKEIFIKEMLYWFFFLLFFYVPVLKKLNIVHKKLLEDYI